MLSGMLVDLYRAKAVESGCVGTRLCRGTMESMGTEVLLGACRLWEH